MLAHFGDPHRSFGIFAAGSTTGARSCSRKNPISTPCCNLFCAARRRAANNSPPTNNMNFRKLAVSLLVTLAFDANQARAEDSQMKAFIDDLMAKMTLKEKIGQMNLVPVRGVVTGPNAVKNVPEKVRRGEVGAILNGYSIDTIRDLQDMAVKETRLHIPLLFGFDVIHGYKTIFPIPLAMSCTWDPALIERSARIAAREASANGLNWVYSPMVDIARDPRWGRIAEGSGEDPLLGALFAKAVVRGYQGNDLAANDTVLACVKHFALYGASEAGRDYNTVDMSRLTMFNDYMPPYQAAIDAGAGSVMTSFNVVDDIPATANRWLLTELLREQWGFTGFVVTDFNAIAELRAHGLGGLEQVSALALRAGADLDMGSEAYVQTLEKCLNKEMISQDLVEVACRRILEAKYKLGLFQDPYRGASKERAQRETFTSENLEAAREVAARSMVLLKNDEQLLPLKKAGRVALIGPLADRVPDMLGSWAGKGEWKRTVSILEGMRNLGGKDVQIVTAVGSPVTDEPMLAKITRWQASIDSTQQLREEAVSLAQSCDVVVAVLGEPAAWSGEAKSRADISLPEVQKTLLKSLLETGKPVVLVLCNGRPLTLPWEEAHVKAILEAWQGGTQAGNAVADILFGNYNPSGKLTTTFPQSVGQIPLYYNHKNTGRPYSAKDAFTSKYIDISNEPLFPFGYGLSYTTFKYGEAHLSKTVLKGDETLTVTVSVTNTGRHAGEEVVQLYLQDPAASVSRPVKELKHFRKIMLQPGEIKVVPIEVTTADLKFHNSKLVYDWEPGEFVVYVGTNSRDTTSARVTWTK